MIPESGSVEEIIAEFFYLIHYISFIWFPKPVRKTWLISMWLNDVLIVGFICTFVTCMDIFSLFN